MRRPEPVACARRRQAGAISEFSRPTTQREICHLDQIVRETQQASQGTRGTVVEGALPLCGGATHRCASQALNVTVPNAERAVIAVEKLTEYLLNMSHKRGAAKARLLLGVGYRPDAPRLLESDLRAQHLSLDVTRTSENAYGVVYEIEGPIKTPSGKTVRFCSIWQIEAGTDVPRFITMYPR
jgi:hypothetical protein